MRLALPGARLPWPDRHLPGELLFSYAARLGRLNALGDSKSTLNILFGARRMIPSADLPSHLDDAFARIGQAGQFANVVEMIERATLYPYYRFFLSAERWQALLARARARDGGGLKTSLGLVASGFGASAVMRSCSECNRESWEAFGAVYWHAVHQLPGVLVCPIHARALVPHFRQSNASNRHALKPMPLKVDDTELNQAWMPTLLGVARLAQAVLNYRGDGLSPQQRRAVCLAEIKRRGWVRGRQQIQWEPIVQGLAARFHGFEPFDFKRRLLSCNAQSVSWLRSVLDNRDRVIHPHCHILLIEFLFGSLERFLRAGQLAPEVALPSPAIEVERSAHFALLDGRLSCREAARQLDCSVTTVVQHRRANSMPISERRKVLHPQIVRNLGLALARGEAIDETARRHGVSMSSVYRILAQSNAISSARSAVMLAAARFARRTRWLDACAARPTVGVKGIRKAEAATYAWLYRHDREWLAANCPVREVREPTCRVDWQQRDKELARTVKRVAVKLKGERGSCHALSVTELIKAVYSETSARRNAERLPRFWKAVCAWAAGPASDSPTQEPP